MRILVIEQNWMFRESMGLYLKRRGHTVITCADPSELDALDETALDVVIAERKGIDFAREIRGRGRCTPVIILTNEAEEAEKENHDNVVRRILPKPSRPRTLLETAAGLGVPL